MMEETFQELKEAMELYAKCQQQEHIVEQSRKSLDSIGNNFCQDFMQEMDLFQSLFTEVGLGPPIEWNFLSWMEDPFVEHEIPHQIVRIFAINKHLQMHWKNCKEVYKRAAEKPLVQISDDDGNNTDEEHKCTVTEGIRELFFIYKETIKENQPETPDHLLLCVSRFLKVFLNVFRVLSLRLFWPVCVKSQEKYHQSRIAQEEEDENEDKSPITSTSIRCTSEDELVAKYEEVSSTDKIVSVADEESEASGIWYLTIETSDHRRLKVPFQNETTTLGTLLLAASPVFDRMLETPMAEKSSRFLKMDDFESLTVSRFLSYLESGKVDVDTLEECFELYQLAHKYQVEQLVLDCTETIEKLMVLNSEDAEQVAEFSKFFGDDTLMSTVDYFRFFPRAITALWGLTDDFPDLAPLSPETSWAMTVKGEGRPFLEDQTF